MPYMNPNYRVASHTRFNDGTSSDLSQSLAQRPGWLLSVEAFGVSSAALAPAHLFIFDTSAAVTTVSTPIWQGVIPYSLFESGATRTAQGGGFIADLANRTLNNGLAYAISSAATVAALSTAPANSVKVNFAYQTSSCL